MTALCKLDTDGDGNCPLHPDGCPNRPTATEARRMISLLESVGGMVHAKEAARILFAMQAKIEQLESQGDMLMCKHGLVFDRCTRCMTERIAELHQRLARPPKAGAYRLALRNYLSITAAKVTPSGRSALEHFVDWCESGDRS